MNTEMLKIIARLESLKAISDAKIRSDPLPYIEASYEAVLEAKAKLLEVRDALSPPPRVERESDPVMHYDPVRQSYENNRNALHILDRYLNQ